MNNLKTGKRGEEKAREYLEEEGYNIIERNHKNKYGEIDIIAKKNEKLVFVEVRSKIDNNFGTPEETVNAKKKKKLKQNALAYATFKNYEGFYRVDLVCIIFSKEGELLRLTHHKNICC